MRLLKLVVSAVWLVQFSPSVFAGYVVNSDVQTLADGYRYTWSVYNQDQSWGLDMFMVQVPLQTDVLSFTVPQSYDPQPGAYWIMQQQTEGGIDPHTDLQIFPPAAAGMEWLRWSGLQSSTVYPAGTTATFSITTDSAVAPGTVPEISVTYTPQNNPNYYLPWQGETIGPAITVPEPSAAVIIITMGWTAFGLKRVRFMGRAGSERGFSTSPTLDLPTRETVERLRVARSDVLRVAVGFSPCHHPHFEGADGVKRVMPGSSQAKGLAHTSPGQRPTVIQFE